MALEKIEGIVIDVIRHNDRNNVVTLFCRNHGRISFISPVGSGKTARLRNARLMTMSVIETEVNFRSSRSLQLLGAFNSSRVWRSLYFDPVKSAMVMFMSEFLHRYLRDSSAEPLLWEYVVGSLERLDATRGSIANFHLAFLIGMLHFAGIMPDMSGYEAGDYFDMLAGESVADRPLHRNFLTAGDTMELPKLLKMNFRNQHLFRLTAQQRREVMEGLLRYFSIHLPGLGSLRSPMILAEVFS